MTSLQDVQLNPDSDSFIVIKFTGIQSAAFQIFPVNVSPVQMIAVAKMLEWQATNQMEEAYKAKQPPKIAVPEPGTIITNAK